MLLLPALYPPGLHRGLHCFQFGVNAVARAQVGDFFFQAFRPGHAKRIGAPFGEVGAPFKHFEAREGVFGTPAVQHFARLGAGDRALDPVGDRILASACLTQLVLKLRDIGFIGLERVVDRGHAQKL